METRRQHKLARVIRDSVSKTIQNKLSDPRITGFVSVTEVDVSPDSKNATVSLSIFGVDEAAGRATFAAIQHAIGHIQAILGKDLPGRTCPHLRFAIDTKMKKTIQTLQLIEEANRPSHLDDDDAAMNDQSESDSEDEQTYEKQ